ncbi:MAG: siphovirus ReqiPepy6 Gp37-like family protein [Clostridiales bacterium]|nr:siphovirus ReqiPepy6 Gp37-like family protein [Clostridiales bacterium]
MDRRINVRFFDKELKFLGEMDAYIGLEFVRRWTTYGEFKLFVFEITQEMKHGHYVMLNNDPRKTGIIKRIQNGDADDTTAEIDGFTLVHILTQRLTYPPEGKAYHAFHAPAEDIICSLVTANAVDTLDSNRVIPFLEVKPSLSRGDRIYYQTRYDNLCDAVKELCEASGMGVAITLDADRKKLVFEVLEGIDRSSDQENLPPMVFNKDYDNVTNREYISDMSEFKNCAVTAGQGDGADRKIAVVGGENTGMERYEVFVDARDIEDDTKLPDRGKSKLAEYANTDSYSSDVDSGKYHVKWDLGDIVTTIDREYGVLLNERIVEVTETFDSSGYVVSPTFGSIRKTILDKVQDVGKNEPLVEGIKGDQGDQGEQGIPGPQGYSMQYHWDGTNLGVKREDEASYKYSNLQGPQGEQGSAPQMLINSDGHLIAIYD